MTTKYLRRWVPALALLVIFATVGVSRGDDKDRDRKARAALALAGPSAPTGSAIATAPPPRPKAQTYPEGYRRAADGSQPLVVFVGLDQWAVKGAVVAKADTFAGTEAPAVVVGYPVADRLYVHATLRGADATPGEVQASADAAAKKIDAPPAKPMPAPAPVDWMLRAGPPAKPPCPCGDGCQCAAGKCPGGCSAAKPVQAPAPAYREVWYTDGRRTWRQLELVAPGNSAAPATACAGCANGRCPQR